MNVTDRANVKQIIVTFEANGIKIPKPVADAHAAMTKLTSRTRDLGAGGGDLAGAVAAALADDRDPSADPEVQRLVVVRALAGETMHVQLETLAYERLRGVCREHADDIVRAWRRPFGKAAERLRTAHDQLGDIDLTDAQSVLNQRGDAAEVWATARSAEQTIDGIVTGWTMLAMFTALASSHRDRRPFRFAVPVTAAVDPKLTPWHAVAQQIELSLPTFEEYRERVAAHAAMVAEPQMVVDQLRSSIAGREIRVPVR